MSSGTASVRGLVKAVLRCAGLKVIRHPGGVESDTALMRLRDAGMTPHTVFDVGAAFGDWSAACAGVFPRARYVLLEPLTEYRPILDARAAKIGNATVVNAAASNVSGTTTFNVHEDLVGSSLLKETEGGNVDGVERTVPTSRVDDVARSHSLRGPFLLKVDVQGAELAVLEGATEVLRNTTAVVVEVSFLDFFLGGASFADVVKHMSARGFVVHDIFGLMRRPVDHALAQADLLFIRKDAPVRAELGFATPTQRSLQNARFKAEFANRLAKATQSARDRALV